MEIILSDGRKATVIGKVTDKMSKIRFEDGREIMWPTNRISHIIEGRDTINFVVIPAIDRLEEVQRYLKAVRVKVSTTNTMCGALISVDPHDFFKLVEIEQELIKEVIEEAKQKWGLT